MNLFINASSNLQLCFRIGNKLSRGWCEAVAIEMRAAMLTKRRVFLRSEQAVQCRVSHDGLFPSFTPHRYPPHWNRVHEATPVRTFRVDKKGEL